MDKGRSHSNTLSFHVAAWNVEVVAQEATVRPSLQLHDFTIVTEYQIRQLVDPFPIQPSPHDDTHSARLTSGQCHGYAIGQAHPFDTKQSSYS